jgi:hypothetical protein
MTEEDIRDLIIAKAEKIAEWAKRGMAAEGIKPWSDEIVKLIDRLEHADKPTR